MLMGGMSLVQAATLIHGSYLKESRKVLEIHSLSIAAAAAGKSHRMHTD